MNAVGIVLVLVSIVDGRAVCRCFFRAVIDVTHIVELELLTLFATIGIGELIACIESAIELYARL